MILSRIKQYIDSKHITIAELESSTGMSNGSFGVQLRKGKTIGVDKLEKILSIYTDINIQWLFTGQGEMINPNVNDQLISLGDNNTKRSVVVNKEYTVDDIAALKGIHKELECRNRELENQNRELENRIAQMKSDHDLLIYQMNKRIELLELLINKT